MPPIENIKSDLFRDQGAGGDVIDSRRNRGRTYTATGTITHAADALNTSKYLLARIPSHALIHEDTRFDVENYSFAAVRIGTHDDVDALVSVLQSAGNTVQPVTFGDANHGKELWEILGLAANPGGDIALYAHAIADATGAGSMPFQIVWIID